MTVIIIDNSGAAPAIQVVDESNAAVIEAAVAAQQAAAADAAAAATSAEQAASLTGLPAPSATNALSYLRVNATGNAYECRAILQMASDLGLPVSLKMFGAQGLQTTDDTTPLLNAMAAGGPIYVPPGQYNCDAPIKFMANGTRLIGASAGTSIINFTAAGTSGVLSNMQGTQQLEWCGASDIQFLDNGGLNRIIDMTDMQHCHFERCFTYGAKGLAGSVGVYLASTNIILQCTYNRIKDHLTGNVQYGAYYTDGANANKWEGGRSQSPLTNAMGIILAPTTFNAVNANSIRDFGVEQPGQTMIGVQLNGNTSGTLIDALRAEAIKTPIVVSKTDAGVLILNPYMSGCATGILDASTQGARIVYGSPGEAQINYNGAANSAIANVRCSVAKAATGQYQVTGLPFNDMLWFADLTCSQPQIEVVQINDTTCNILTYTNTGISADATIFGTFHH